jgi:tetraacyldisaccharide 4'-kinase
MKLRLQKKIETIIDDRAEQDPSWLSRGLLVASLFYGWGVRLRELGYTKGFFKSRHLPCAVVSIGNITVGGTGKTPMTIYMAELIRGLGLRAAVISRGYGGKAEKKGGIVCDGQAILMQPEISGDEPFMIAGQLETIPVLVGSDRFESGKTAMKRFRPDVLLLDDAFQHIQLTRDMDIVLMDAERPLDNGYLLPRGGLREKEAALNRCHAVVFTRAHNTDGLADKRMRYLLKGKPVFQSFHKPYIYEIIKGRSENKTSDTTNEWGLEWIAGKRVYVFSGIARNNDFKKTLENLGCIITGFEPFSDHYRYSQKDIKEIVTTAVRYKSDCLVTTEKDYFRIPGKGDCPIDLVVMGVKICFNDDGFDQFVRNRLDRILKNRRPANHAGQPLNKIRAGAG